MAEAIAVISFVSAIVGLLATGSRAISRLNDFRADTHEIPDALKHISSQLPLVVDSLSRSKTRAQSGELNTETQKALVPTLEACKELLDRLDGLLKDLLPVKGDSSWDRKMKALKSLCKDKQMQGLLAELDRYIIIFTLHNTSISGISTASAVFTPDLSIKTLPSNRDPNFIDRPDVFHALEANLDKHGRAALSGVGGVGKTQIAIEYCYRYLDRQSAGQVFWIYSSNVKRLSQTCKNIAEKLRLPGTNDPKTNSVQLFHNYLLEDKTIGKLIVLDNVDDGTMLDEDLNFPNHSVKFADLIPRTSLAKVLVTTRDRRVGERLAVRGSTISVQTMTMSDSIRLLDSYIPSDKTSLRSEQEQLMESLGYLPLAITQAAAYITEACMSIAEYLSLLQESPDQFEELLNESLSDDRRGHQEGNSPIKTWKISFDHILQTDKRSAQMLSLMAFFDRNHIQSSLLRHKKESKLRFLKAAATLECFSLISRDPGGDAYKMHRLVQVATQAWARVQKFTSRVRLEAITNLATLFPSGEYETWRECEALLPHTRVIMSHSHESDDTRLQNAKLLTKLAWFYRCQGRYAVSINAAQEACSIFQHIRGPNDPGAHSNTITKIDCQLQLFDDASIRSCIDALREICTSLETQLGGEDPETLRGLGNLAWALYNNAGLRNIVPEEAILLLRKILPIRERVLGLEHPRSMTTMNNLGLALETKYNLEAGDRSLDKESDEIGIESLGLLRECLSRRKQYLGSEHPDTLEIQGNLANILLERSAYTEAEQLLRSAISSKVALFGPLHVDIIPSLSTLARCLSACGRSEEAIDVGRETVSLAETFLGPTHRMTILIRYYLASDLESAGRYTDAVRQYQQVLVDARIEDNKVWSDLESVRDRASFSMVYLILTKLSSRPRETLDRQILLREVVSKGTSGWRRCDLDDIQIIRLLANASNDIIKRLAPIPNGWEIRLSKSNEVYFANNKTKATTWLDPRVAEPDNDKLPAPPAFDSEHVTPTRDLCDPPPSGGGTARPPHSTGTSLPRFTEASSTLDEASSSLDEASDEASSSLDEANPPSYPRPT